jgi:hypothetical protein
MYIDESIVPVVIFIKGGEIEVLWKAVWSSSPEGF